MILSYNVPLRSTFDFSNTHKMPDNIANSGNQERTSSHFPEIISLHDKGLVHDYPYQSGKDFLTISDATRNNNTCLTFQMTQLSLQSSTSIETRTISTLLSSDMFFYDGFNHDPDSNCQRNNSNKSDIPLRKSESDTYRDCQYSGRVIRVEGDGRCLFRSLVTCWCHQLQKAIRDEFGCPMRHEDSTLETQMADELRQQVVHLMEDNAQFYSQLGKDVINADQPSNQSQRYHKFGDRLNAMTIPSTMPGDLELNATSALLEVRILVLDVNLRYIFLYGKDRFPEATVYAIRYTRLGPDVGHFDAVILDFPVENVIGLLASQKIDHLDTTDMEPSMKDLAALSIRDDSLNHGNKLDKSCQTQSNMSLAGQNGVTTERSMHEEITCDPRTPTAAAGKETTSKKDVANSALPVTCTYCHSLISHPTHGTRQVSRSDRPGNDISSKHTIKLGTTTDSQPNLPENHDEVKNSENSSQNPLSKTRTLKELSNQQNPTTIQRKEQATAKSKQPQKSYGVDNSFGEPRESNPTYHCLHTHVYNHHNNKTDGQSCLVARKRGRARGDVSILEKPASSPKIDSKCRPGLKNKKRKLQDCNENHKATKPKKRKAHSDGRQPRKLRKAAMNKRDNPSSMNSTPTTKGSNPGKQFSKAGSEKNAVPFPKILRTPSFLPDFSNRQKCFVCLGQLPVSRLLGVQCFLCEKVAHRPCVGKYLNWDFADMEDDYFLCQHCAKLFGK